MDNEQEPTPERPELRLEIGGQAHRVVMDFGALCRLEKTTNKNPYDLAVWRNMGPTILVQTILACTKQDHPELTEEEVIKKFSKNAREATAAIDGVRKLVLAVLVTRDDKKKNTTDDGTASPEPTSQTEAATS